MNEFVKRNVVILAETYNNKGKYDVSWIQLIKDGDAVGKPSAFNCKPKERPITGVIYTAEVKLIDDDINTMRFGTLKFGDFNLLPREFLTDIHTKQRNNSQVANAQSQALKTRCEHNKHELDILKSLRVKYQKTNTLGKLAMEVRLLSYLRNGRDL